MLGRGGPKGPLATSLEVRRCGRRGRALFAVAPAAPSPLSSMSLPP